MVKIMAVAFLVVAAALLAIYLVRSWQRHHRAAQYVWPVPSLAITWCDILRYEKEDRKRSQWEEQASLTAIHQLEVVRYTRRPTTNISSAKSSA